jgi:hypothetical protein
VVGAASRTPSTARAREAAARNSAAVAPPSRESVTCAVPPRILSRSSSRKPLASASATMSAATPHAMPATAAAAVHFATRRPRRIRR